MGKSKLGGRIYPGNGSVKLAGKNMRQEYYENRVKKIYYWIFILIIFFYIYGDMTIA